MPSLLTETDIGGTAAVPPAPTSESPAAAPAPADSGTETLRRELLQLRSELAISAGETRRSLRWATVAILLAVALTAALVARRPGAASAGTEPATRAQIEELLQTVQRGEATRAPVATTAKPAASVPAAATPGAAASDCAALPSDVRTSDVDFAVRFAQSSARILPESTPTLDGVARMLALVPGRCVLIEGHADASGKADKNVALSRERATAVRDYLVTQGQLDGRFLVAVGRGAASPTAGSDALDPQNRRVVFKVVTGTP